VPLDIVILGPPGAGKGTQGQRISAELGIPHINTGDMYRAAVAAGTELGEKVHPYLEAGELVPDELTIAVVRDRLSQPDTVEGFVLDGFPRTLPQAEALDMMLAQNDRELSVVLGFQLSEELAEQRLLKRAVEQGREDDTPEVIHRRTERAASSSASTRSARSTRSSPRSKAFSKQPLRDDHPEIAPRDRRDGTGRSGCR
jgi:adenylate kinase